MYTHARGTDVAICLLPCDLEYSRGFGNSRLLQNSIRIDQPIGVTAASAVYLKDYDLRLSMR